MGSPLWYDASVPDFKAWITGALTSILVPDASLSSNVALKNGNNAFTGSNSFATNPLDLLVGQLKFPATQNPSADANTLDDYEEGTWTPTIGGSTGESGQVYSVQVGTYVKIGKNVWCSFRVGLSTLGTISNGVQIKGFPFTVANVTPGAFATMAMTWSTTTTSFQIMQANIVVNDTVANVIALTAPATNMISPIFQGDLAATTEFRGWIMYQAAS